MPHKGIPSRTAGQEYDRILKGPENENLEMPAPEIIIESGDGGSGEGFEPGTVLNVNCTELLKTKATVVYMRESVDELVRNLEITGIAHRPLLAGTDGLEFDAVAADIINRLP